MNNSNTERLYHYLPQVYRRRDKNQNDVLRTLFAIMEKELQGFEQEIDTSYANTFIETCETWVIPYIAELFGISNLQTQQGAIVNQRPYIANVLRYRKRKGQQTTLERVINDITGWRATSVAFYKRLATTQHLQHIRIPGSTTAKVRNLNAMETLDTPFDRNTHTAAIRDPKRYAAKYSFDIAGIFIWRLRNYPITAGTAHKVAKGQYTFHPLGLPMPLYQKQQISNDLALATQETNLPAALRPRALADDLSAYNKLYQNLKPDARPKNSDYYGPERSFYLTMVASNGTKTPILQNQIISMNLNPWRLPSNGKIGIDVKTGRIALASNITDPDHIDVNYYYGFSADIGGGHYERYKSLATVDSTTTLVRVAKSNNTNGNGKFNSINAALTANKAMLTAKSEIKHLIIQIEDDATYTETIEKTPLGNTASLTIQAASGTRPCIKLTKTLEFSADKTQNNVTLNGLLIQGSIELNDAINLNINHTTLIPVENSASVKLSVPSTSTYPLKMEISNSITGALQLPNLLPRLDIQDSIIDAKSDSNIAIYDKQGSTELSGPSLSLQRCTVIGKINVVKASLISESIITGTVNVERIQTGCVRYSSLPIFSHTSKTIVARIPERYRCQPELNFIPLAEKHALKLGLQNYKDVQAKDPTWWNLTLTQLQPQFTSLSYGHPSYMQLRRQTSSGIKTGAEDGSEMGVFKHLKQPQREINLKNIVEEFLGLDLNAEIFYVN